MKIDNKIPFYLNPDDTHCFQACLKMVIEYFWPECVYSWEELDIITSKIKGLWTWPMAGLLFMQEKGAEVKIIKSFDYDNFSKNGAEYLRKRYGKEVANAQIKNSDIDREIGFSKKFIKKIKIKKDIPKIEDLKQMLKDNYVIIANINSRILNNKNGYVGHFVVIKSFNQEGFLLNDPGLPGIENRKVDFDLFNKAWSYPNEEAKNIMAFRLE